MHEFKLPDIGEGLSEAELLEWSVKQGERIAEGEEVAQISTDKVNVDLLAPVTGTVAELIGEPGDVITVGTVIMRIDTGGDAEKPDTAAGESTAAPPAASSGEQRPAKTAVAVKAAPIVRKYAAESGVDLSQVSGSGPGGQIVRADIDRHQQAVAVTDNMVKQSENVPAGTRFRLSGSRLAAARNLSESATRQVSTTISFEIMADGLQNQMEQLAEQAEQRNLRLSPAAVVAKGLSRVLRLHPKFNATIGEDQNEIIIRDSMDLGIAVNSENGLLVPVIQDIGNKNTLDIAAEISRLSERVRSGEISRSELSGSSFTLSSTGGLEKATLTATTPIINYPNVATLWISRITTRPRVINGLLEAGPVMYCSLSFDHRFLHGADGIAFVNDLEAELCQGSGVAA